MESKKPELYTCLSPALLNLYEVKNAIVVIIDVLRATSTIAAVLHNGGKAIIPVDSVAKCISLGKKIEAITAGERDGQIAEGLQYGNSPLEYPESFIKGKRLVLTTTNGTKMLQMALERGANTIITGSFPNLSAVCDFLVKQKMNVVLGCAAWKDRLNMEDTLFAGAVISRVKEHFDIQCDASIMAETLYNDSEGNLFEFMKNKSASHYQRLMGFGVEDDIKYCLTEDVANVLPLYKDGELIPA